MSDKTMTAEVITFPAGDIMFLEDGSIQFRFRNMDYVYVCGSDSTEFMGITIDKETAEEIKKFFRKVLGY